MSNKALVKVTTPLGELTVKDNELRRGNLQLIRAQVALEEGIDYTGIQGKMLLSPEGADKLNQIAGLSILEPQDDRSWDDKRSDGGFVEVRRRCIVAGRTPTGAMQVVSSSIVFSPRAYFMQALMKKIQYNQSCGFLGGIGDEPKKSDEYRMKYFAIDEEIGVWADLKHKDIFGLVTAYTQDRKFADRRASGIVRRNALCQHAALGGQKMIGKYNKDQGAPATVALSVFAWRGDDFADDDQEATAVAMAVGRGDVAHPVLTGADRKTADVTEEDMDPSTMPAHAEDASDQVEAQASDDLPPIPGEEG